MKKICQSCGREVLPGSRFCEYCGAGIPVDESDAVLSDAEPTFAQFPPPPPLPSQIQYQPSNVLPELDGTPDVAKAINTAWQITMQDVVGVIVTGLLMIVCFAVCGFFYFLSYIPMGLVYVGMMGWAEERRSGNVSQVGSLFNHMFKRPGDALLLGLVSLLLGLIFIIPSVLAMTSAFGIQSLNFFHFFTQMSQTSSPTMPNFQRFVSLISITLVLALIFQPFLYSLTSLTAWGIAKGNPFKESISWAWAQMKKHLFAWWWAGLIIPILQGLGVLLCYIGMLVTYPYGAIIYAELANDSGPEY